MKVKEESEKTGFKLNIEKLRSWHPVPHFMANTWGNNGNSDRFLFLASRITADSDCSHEIKKTFAPWKKIYDKLGQHIKKQRHYFSKKGLSSLCYGFSSSHVWM